MTVFGLRLGYLSLAFLPGAVSAQEVASESAGSSSQLSDDVPAKEPETSESSSRLPPNVSITTPDGRPLSPDLLKKVLDILESDPEIKALARNSRAPTLRKLVDNTEIVVTARRQRGSVVGNIEPSRTFTPIDIRAYGAATVTELIGALGDEGASARGTGTGRPIVLLNGRRISSFEEIALYPSEAIERMEVFPETLAVQYGFSPDQKVVNLVTFKFFSQNSARMMVRQPTLGGGSQLNAGSQILRIIDEKRYSLAVNTERAFQILESRRNIVQPSSSMGQAPYRTLRPQVFELSISGGLSGLLANRTAFAIRASGGVNRAKALLGTTAAGILSQVTESYNKTLGSTLSGQLGRWGWSSTSSFRSDNSTSKFKSAFENTAQVFRYQQMNYAADASLVGSLFRFADHSIQGTLRTDLEIQSIRTSASTDDSSRSFLSRRAFGSFLSISIPLAKRTPTSRLSLGDVSIDGHIKARSVSDRGTLIGFGGTLRWSPVESLRLQVSRTRETIAPTINQLRAPVISIPNVRLFDFSRGDTVDVLQTIGGNQALRDESINRLDVGIGLKPWRSENFSITLDYSRQKTSDGIIAFPIVNQNVLDEFSDRFIIDAGGRISDFDARPINVHNLFESKMRVGLSWTRPLAGSSAGKNLIFIPATDGDPPPGTLPPNTRIIDNPPGTPLPPEIINALSRIYISVFYTRRPKNTVNLIDGGPDLDLLNGFALNGLGGTPRSELSIAAGLFKHGLGVRTNTTWRSSSFVMGDASRSHLGTRILKFTYKPIVDIQFFLNPEERVVGSVPGWIRGMQVTLSVKNALNLQPVVRDELNRTPLRFQSAYLDPIGRSVELSVRKIF